MLKLIISFLFLFNLLIAQPKIKHYDNWIFGSRTGVTFNTQDGNPRAINLGDYYYTEGTSSFSDDNGNLIYYIDLSYNVGYLKRSNGFILDNEGLYTTTDATSPGLFIQDITNPDYVHLFTVDEGSRFAINNNNLINGGVHYILLEKDRDGFLREVNLFRNSVEKIAAVYNEVDNIVWVLTHELGNDVFNIYKIDENGFDETAIKQSIGFEHKSSSESVATGRMNFSPNGTTLAVTIPFYDPDLDGVYEPKVQIFDFDPKTGVLSNPRELNINQHTYATSFSPNGKVLYVKVSDAIYQYDLTICDWDEMIDKKYVINTKKSPFYNAIERGPNGVIYCGRDKNRYLDAIQNPDVVGAGCQYVEDVVELGFNDNYQFMWGLPTVLNSFFTGDYDEPCVQEDKAEYSVSYPSNLMCIGEDFDITISSDKDEEFSIEIRRTFPGFKIIGEFNSLDSKVIYYEPYDYDENAQYQRSYQALIKKNNIVIDTLRYFFRYFSCCGNTVQNPSFNTQSTSSYCSPIDYSTDLDFRVSTSSGCPSRFTALGQIAATGSINPEIHVPNFGMPPSGSRGRMLVGDPLPNVPQRGWYQENPTRKGTRYKFTAHVCNVEKTPRYIGEPRQLNFWLGVKNRNQDLVLKRLEDVQYEDDWIELSDEFIAEDNTSELAVWVLGESEGSLPSYGFAIDDISLIPIVEYDLESQNDTLLCEGDPAIKLDNRFNGEIGKIEWTPTTGLNDPSSLTPIANPTESTTYSLKITDKYYCEFESEIIVEVDPCLDRCSPDLSVYLTDKEIEIGESFCINGVFIPECEIETYLNRINIYFEYDPRLLRFDSATTDFDIIPTQNKNILVLKFDKTDFIINVENEFSFCFTALLGSSKVTVLEVEEDESYNLVDFTNSNINFLSCDQPFRQIDLMLLTSFNFSISDEKLMSVQLTTEEVGLFQFQIIDLNGRILNTESFNTSKDEYVNEEVINIDLQSLSLGNYFIRMIAPNGKTYTLKFVKD